MKGAEGYAKNPLGVPVFISHIHEETFILDKWLLGINLFQTSEDTANVLAIQGLFVSDQA